MKMRMRGGATPSRSMTPCPTKSCASRAHPSPWLAGCSPTMGQRPCLRWAGRTCHLDLKRWFRRGRSAPRPSQCWLLKAEQLHSDAAPDVIESENLHCLRLATPTPGSPACALGFRTASKHGSRPTCRTTSRCSSSHVYGGRSYSNSPDKRKKGNFVDPHWCGELKARTERTLLFYHHRLNHGIHTSQSP